MTAPSLLTADLFDAHGDACQSCATQLKQYGKRRVFSGRIRTVQCRDDNVLVRRALETPSEGEVLVVDGGGSLNTALLGDLMAEIGRKNGWSGVIIFGAIRDGDTLAAIDFGVKALGSNPKKSAKDGVGTAGERIQNGGVVFVPGHWVYCDNDGILVAARELGGGVPGRE